MNIFWVFFCQRMCKKNKVTNKIANHLKEKELQKKKTLPYDIELLPSIAHYKWTKKI